MKVGSRRLQVPIRKSTINAGFSFEKFVDDTNKILDDHGAFILMDGQILQNRVQVEDIVHHHLEEEWNLKLREIVDGGLAAGVINEEESQSLDLETIEWSADQQQYFGVENPFQVPEDLSDFGYSWASVDTHESFLKPT